MTEFCEMPNRSPLSLSVAVQRILMHIKHINTESQMGLHAAQNSICFHSASLSVRIRRGIYHNLTSHRQTEGAKLQSESPSSLRKPSLPASVQRNKEQTRLRLKLISGLNPKQNENKTNHYPLPMLPSIHIHPIRKQQTY